MKRFAIGVGALTYLFLTAQVFLLHVLNTIYSYALMFNDSTIVTVSAALMLLTMRAQSIPQTVYVAVKTRFSMMHLFYGGIILVLIAVVPLTFVAGGAIITTTIVNLFSAASPTGTQIMQGILLTLGVFFMLVDFPHRGHNSPKF